MKLTLLCFLLLLAPPIYAQELPDSPKPQPPEPVPIWIWNSDFSERIQPGLITDWRSSYTPDVTSSQALFYYKPCNSHQRKWYKPLSSNMCQADYDKWVAPRLNDHWYKDKVLWTGIGIIGTSIFLDTHSTSQSPSSFEEGNPFLGPHPSTAKVAAYGTLDFGIQFGLQVGAWKVSHNDPSKPWRVLGQWGLPVAIALINGRTGINNYRLNARCRNPNAPGCVIIK